MVDPYASISIYFCSHVQYIVCHVLHMQFSGVYLQLAKKEHDLYSTSSLALQVHLSFNSDSHDMLS